MADIIGVVGESGTGKSTSIRRLNSKETFIINVGNKSLPFAGARNKYTKAVWNKETNSWSGNLFNINLKKDAFTQITSMLIQLNTNKSLECYKTIILDDIQFEMGFDAMNKASEKGYDKYIQIASNFFDILKYAMGMRDGVRVILLAHQENVGSVDYPKYKFKTIGKMVDNFIGVDTLMTYIFFTKIITDDSGNSKYVFQTRSTGDCTAKTPMGCFENFYIPNDLNYALNVINEFEINKEDVEEEYDIEKELEELKGLKQDEGI